MRIVESCHADQSHLVERPDREVGAGAGGATIRLKPQEQMQTMIGFGGAFTEAAAYAVSFLGQHEREQVLRDYFDAEQGNGYRLGRVTVHSCDFSLENYSYMNDRFDTELTTFSVDRDEVLVLPFIRDANRVAGGQLQFFASPWSPPSFMKTNNLMNHGGTLRPEFAGMWADYLVRFLQEYRDRGVSCFGVTTQNEPEAHQTWESCLYTGEEERDFVRDHLGPALAASDLDTRVILYDHNRDHVYDRGRLAYEDAQASQYLWGAGVHWYMSEDFENLDRLHREFPDKHLLFTEGCCAWSTPEGTWDAGEFYAHEIINDLNNWVEGWTDWNLVLDERGGPNHVENYCAAPIIVDTQKRRVIHQPSYYFIGHLSRYLRPGSVRIGHELVDGLGLEVTTWQTDAGIVLVVLNATDGDVTYAVENGTERVGLEIPAHSIQTVTL